MKPLVSVILPTYNEARSIEATLRSLLAQECGQCELEILVIDGGSSDQTTSLVTPFLDDGRIRLLNNPSRSAPAAFNLGLRAAAGDYVCILGAHAQYARDYIEICYEEMLTHHAAGASGRVITVPASDRPSARLAAWCLGGRFASSPNSVRTQLGGIAETIPYPLFRKAALLELGGYNEELIRNQDNDMNHRLRAAGHKLYLSAKTQAIYIARPNVTSLFSYAYRSGMWNALTLRVNAACMRLRHFVPFVFVMCGAALALSAWIAHRMDRPTSVPLGLIAAVWGGHLLCGAMIGVNTAIRERSRAALLLPLVILGFHFAYGIGTLAGFLSLSRGANPAAKNQSATAISAKYPL